MKKLITGLLAFFTTMAFSVSVLANTFPDGTYQAGYLIKYGTTTCPPHMSVIGTKIITDPGYPWTVVPHNFQNLTMPATDIPFAGAAMVNDKAQCMYRVNNYGEGAPAVMLVDDHHYLLLGTCGNVAGDCVFNAKH